MQCGEHDNFILKALPEMSKGIGVQHEGGYGGKKREQTECGAIALTVLPLSKPPNVLTTPCSGGK